MRKLLLFSCFLFVVLVSASISHATYDYTTGRWLQRDPLGINPAGGNENHFYFRKQYKRGFNLYEFVKANPISLYDPMGLDMIGINFTYCCQEEKTENNVSRRLTKRGIVIVSLAYTGGWQFY